MSEKMRDEFEEWLIANTEFDTQRTAFAMTKEEDQQYMCHRTNLAWLAWKASRAALVVELPPEREERFIDSYQEGWNDAIDSCRVRVESVGVTCK